MFCSCWLEVRRVHSYRELFASHESRRRSAFPWPLSVSPAVPGLELFWRLFGRSSCQHSAEISEAFLELRAAHFVAIHEQAHHLAHKTVFTIHRPGHDRLAALGFEREIHGASAFHWPLPIHPHPDEFAGLAFDNGGRTCAYVA